MAHGSHHGDVVPGVKHAAVPLDPERDINAKSATQWVIGGTVVLFALLWLLVVVFSRINEAKRQSKIYSAANEELADVLGEERAFLNGQNPTKKTIEQVVKTLAKK
jgi:hypothetical protein